MIEQNEIKKLIKDGFDLELLSFEFDIPLEQIKRWKNDLDKPNSRNKIEQVSKMQQMRDKYQAILKTNNGNKSTIVEEKELTEKERELVENAIKEIEEKIQEFQSDLIPGEKMKCLAQIISKIQEIQDFPINIEQIENLRLIIHNPKIDCLYIDYKSKLYKDLTKTRRDIVTKLVESIKIKLQNAKSIEEIDILSKELKSAIDQKYPFIVGGLRSEIYNKKTKMQQKKITESINNVPEKIQEIVKAISNGQVDIEKAKRTINEEAEKTFESKPKTRFSLTLEQEQKQIIMKVEKQLKENSEQYQIVSPEKTISILQQLANINLADSMNIVVNNFISRKEFEGAKDIVEQYREKFDISTYHNVIDLKNKIRNAEISNLILKCLNSEQSIEKDNAQFDLIQQFIEKGNIKLQSISLGKSENGIRNITLADIWPEKKDKEK